MWDERYRSGDTPWDVGVVDEHLEQAVSTGLARPGRALEVGCGTGTNARWLAQRGFSVLGVDLSPLAIEKAKAEHAGGSVSFRCLDFLNDEIHDGPFDLVFDRGCFHIFDEASERAAFAKRVASCLSPGGVWLSLIGSTEGRDREHGPPRRSVRDIATAVEPTLALKELRATWFRAHNPSPAAAWLCVAEKRTVPAQPSTRRDEGGPSAQGPAST